jgi:hypothetical protein
MAAEEKGSCASRYDLDVFGVSQSESERLGRENMATGADSGHLTLRVVTPAKESSIFCEGKEAGRSCKDLSY